MALDDPCTLALGLALASSADINGLPSSPILSFSNHRSPGIPTQNKPSFSFSGANLDPSLILSLSGEISDHPKKIDVICSTVSKGGEELFDASPHSSVVSSFSSGRVVVKRERDLSSEDAEVERVSSRVSDEDEDGSNARKKLRLTKQQSALLEESFKHHSTLNPKQKQALARQLNLRPRQVEVWFQNRRARTKLKQTEVDCDFLKKCCETLTEENRRLQKELQELKALKLKQPFYMPAMQPAATLTMCPSCQRNGDGSTKSPFSMASTSKPHFFNQFANYSAAY